MDEDKKNCSQQIHPFFYCYFSRRKMLTKTSFLAASEESERIYLKVALSLTSQRQGDTLPLSDYPRQQEEGSGEVESPLIALFTQVSPSSLLFSPL